MQSKHAKRAKEGRVLASAPIVSQTKDKWPSCPNISLLPFVTSSFAPPSLITVPIPTGRLLVWASFLYFRCISCLISGSFYKQSFWSCNFLSKNFFIALAVFSLFVCQVYSCWTFKFLNFLGRKGQRLSSLVHGRYHICPFDNRIPKHSFPVVPYNSGTRYSI